MGLTRSFCCIADVNGRGESRSKHKEAGDRRQDTDTGRKEGAKAVHEKPGEAARRVSTADKDEKQKDKPSSGVLLDLVTAP